MDGMCGRVGGRVRDGLALPLAVGRATHAAAAGGAPRAHLLTTQSCRWRSSSWSCETSRWQQQQQQAVSGQAGRSAAGDGGPSVTHFMTLVGSLP